MYNKPTSYSQDELFSKCHRTWYYSYIKKIPAVQDMSYAFAGNVIHETIEQHYNGLFKDTDDAKEYFRQLWKKKKLHNSFLKEKIDEYWLMVLNAINKKVPITSTEFKIFYPDVVGYLDGVNTDNDEIHDWKSSKRHEENEKDYKKQLMFYAWLYKRKFDRLPKKATVHYLRYIGEKGILEYEPTKEDMVIIGSWHNHIRGQMSRIVEAGKDPPMCENCHTFCPYKNLCFDNEDTLKFTFHIIGNYIQVDGPLNPLIHKVLAKKFSYELKNAYFIKKAKPMAKTNIEFWNSSKRMLSIGFKSGLVKTLKDYGEYKKKEISIDVKDTRKFNTTTIKMPDKFINDKELRDYQQTAVDKFLRERIAILEMGTGSGKTEVAIELIRRLGVRTLFMVDKIELLRQTKKRIEDCLGIEVGQIGGGEENIKDITVATVQSVVKHLRRYSKLLNETRFAIFDETHKVACRSFWKVAHYLLNTEYRLGISGTAFRDDGNDMYIQAICGYKAYELNAKTLVDDGWLVKPRIIFLKEYMTKEEIDRTEQSLKTGLINETADYANYYNGFIHKNSFRDKLICDTVKKFEGKKILILTKLIEHGQNLKVLLPGSQHLYGATSKEDRKQMFNSFINGNVHVLISTISIFSEGIDIPDLNVIINAAANRGDVKSIQVLGRVLRKIEGKKSAYYLDFVDETRFFRVASRARIKALRSEGHEVEEINGDNFIENQQV